MHKGLEFSSLPLEVENPYGNSLTVFPSFENEDFDFQEGLSPFDDEPHSDSSQYQTCSESWEDFHSLSPFGADWEMEQEFFKSDLSDLECKPQGPTLAELNNQRSTSPLINPEMERLHRIATRTETEGTSSTGTGPQHEMKTTTDGQGMLQRNTENQCSSFITNDAEMSSKTSACDEKGTKSNSGPEIRTRDVTSTITVKQEPTETIELNRSEELMRRIAFLEAKSNSSKTLVSVPHEVVIYVSKSEDELAVIQEESGDEDVDSEDDFEDIIRSGDGETAAKQRKGRRGDTEDLNPNPRRLLEIGRELNRLTKIITDLKPIHSLPMNARNKSKKEKNKLASRACRLKKKAQHESNKLKLHGLELEHQRLISLIGKVKTRIVHDTQGYTVTGDLSNTVEHLIHNTLGDQVIAGHTTAFVESVLKATASATPGCENMDIQFNI